MGSAKYAANKLNLLRVDEYEMWKEHFKSFDDFSKTHNWLVEKVPFYAAENSQFFKKDDWTLKLP